MEQNNPMIKQKNRLLYLYEVNWSYLEFPTVQQVQFTVDGKAENGMSWWGHVGLYD